MEEEYFWFWYGDDGFWQPFDATVMSQIEAGRRQQGLSQIRLSLRGNSYILDMNTFEQTNESSGYSRPIARATALWYWKDDSGNWVRYSEKDSLLLARKDLDWDEHNKVAHLRHGNSTYVVDIVRRKQRNSRTRYEREIHQGPLHQQQHQQQPDNNNSGNQDGAAQTPPSLATNTASNDMNDNSLLGNSRFDGSNRAQQDSELVELSRHAPHHFLCPISGLIMHDPVQTLEGYTYERVNIARYLQQSNNDPTSQRPLPSKDLIDNRDLRELIDQWRQEHQSVRRQQSAAVSRSQVPSASSSRPQVAPQFTTGYMRSEDVSDTVKVVCLGLAGASDAPYRHPRDAQGNLGVHRYAWGLQNDSNSVHCQIYDFVGQNIHHASQKLFFSNRAIYVVVWDMMGASIGSSRVVDKAVLERDIHDKVQFWVDCIQETCRDAVIIPVVSCDGSFGTARSDTSHEIEEAEVQRRCKILRNYIDRLNQDRQEASSSIRWCSLNEEEDPVLRVGGPSKLLLLQNKLLQVARDISIFPTFGQSLTDSHKTVRNYITDLRQHSVLNVAHCHKQLEHISSEELHDALDQLSETGGILYFGNHSEASKVLQQFAILNPSWLIEALSCAVRPDINDVIKAARKRNHQSEHFASSSYKSYHGPVVGDNDIRLVWRDWLCSEETGGTGGASDFDNLLDFLLAMFVYAGIMVPLNTSMLRTSNVFFQRNLSTSAAEGGSIQTAPDTRLFFLPGLLSPQVGPNGDHGKFVGLYSNKEFSKTILAHAVHFRETVSPLVVERICATILTEIHAKASEHEDKSEGQVFVKSIICWRTLLYFQLGYYIRTEEGDIRSSAVDIYAHLVDSSSDSCVGATYAVGGRQCLIISARGEEGNDGRVIWKGGYDLVTRAIRPVLDDALRDDFERSFFCPRCLAEKHLRDTRSWGEWVIQRGLEGGEHAFLCEDGHQISTRLLLGTSAAYDSSEKLFPSTLLPEVHTENLMPGVVMVGLFDANHSSDKIRKVGSGFIVDTQRGLIVTAAHTLMELWGKRDFGLDYGGKEGAKAVIGVLPEKRSDGAYSQAVFRYFASIYKKDPSLDIGESHVDACILQITSRFENDVDGNGDFCNDEISTSLIGKSWDMAKEGLIELETTEECHVGEPIRILGFDQADNTKLNRSFGVSAGYVYKQFETKAVGGERYRYMPRKKTVLMCPTIGGHSGGPCVNQKGQVIGILSCADLTEKSRSYLVPTSEWIHLVPKRTRASLASSSSSSFAYPPKAPALDLKGRRHTTTL